MVNKYFNEFSYILKHKISDVLVESKYITDSKAINLKLYNDGCAVIENLITKDECEKLIKKSIILEKLNPDRVCLESNDSDMRIYGIDNLDEDFKLKSISNDVDQWAQRFYRTKKIKYFQLLGHIKYSENNLGSGGGWHRDSPFSHQFKFILYLSDVHEKNGPFQYIKGSHKTKNIVNYCRKSNENLSRYRFDDEVIDEILQKSDCNEIITVLGKAGTLLIADVKGLHRGKPLEEGERWATTRYYFKGKIPKYFRILIDEK